MPHTIHASFAAESDAEKAAGALIDHGVPRQDVSFIVSERMQPAVPDTAAFPSVTIPPPPELPSLPPRPDTTDDVTPGPGYRYDALGAVIPDTSDIPRVTVPIAQKSIAADTHPDSVAQDGRHVVNMNLHAPDAARGISTTTAADAAKGALEGTGVGLGLGLLLGLAAVAVPGVGWVAGAGALIAGLTAATGAAGAVAGGVYGYLTDQGLPPEQAKQLSAHIEAGQIVLTVNLTGTVSEGEIVTLLNKYGALSAVEY